VKKNTTEPQRDPADIHASTVDPLDPRLHRKRPSGRALKKGPVIGIAAVLGGLLMLAVSLALQPRHVSEKSGGDTRSASAGVVKVSEIVLSAPDNDDPLKVADNQFMPGENIRSTVVAPAASYENAKNVKGQWDADDEEYQRALTASPFFDASQDRSLTAGLARKGEMDMLASSLDRIGKLSGAGIPGLGDELDQNGQQGKNAFMAGEGGARDIAANGELRDPVSPYEVKAGAVIPVSLITGINSDLPGEIIGQVRENVYDTVTGNHLLIPQGSRLMARYDSMVAYGQKRALVCWNRLIMPDGSSLDLGCAPGVGLDGYAGFADKVDNHFDRLLGGVLLSSVLSVGATTSQGEWDDDEITASQLFAANIGQEINRAGQQITRKNLGLQPTIKVRPGYSVNVLVNRDLTLRPYVKK